MWFLGVDWGEAHYDLCLLDQDGIVLAARRIGDGLAGWASCMGWCRPCRGPGPGRGGHRDRPRTAGRGLVGRRLPGLCGHPQVVRRYRGRHGSSRPKSDRGDARVLADLVRTDRHNHRPVAGDSVLVEAVKVLARAHQSLIWARQRHINALRRALREFYPVLWPRSVPSSLSPRPWPCWSWRRLPRQVAG